MIAKTILEQIGGRRFAAMTGSKDFTDMGNGLRMSLARNKTTAASGFIAARHVRKADGKVPLTTHAVVQAAAVAGCNGIRDAPFRQILC